MLIIPTFVLFILLMIDLGILTFEYVSVSNSVREGARFAAVNCNTGTCSFNAVRDRTVEKSSGVLSTPLGSPDDDAFAIEWSGVNRGDSIKVKATHTYKFLFIQAPFLRVEVPVIGCAEMRLEQKDKGTGLPPRVGSC